MSVAVASSTRSIRRRIVPDVVPADYTELFQTYYEYVQGVVRDAGILPVNVEDVSMSILTKFFENAVLEQFDPEYKSAHGGVVRRAVFMTFLTGFVRTYVQHYRDKQWLQYKREGLSTDWTPRNHTTTWLEEYGPRHLDDMDHDSLYDADMVRTIRTHLRTVQLKSRQRGCTLSDLFEETLLESNQNKNGRIDVKSIAERLGVSPVTVRNRLPHLRTEIEAALGL